MKSKSSSTSQHRPRKRGVTRNRRREARPSLRSRWLPAAFFGVLVYSGAARAELPVATTPDDAHYRWDGAKAPVIDGNQLRIDQTADNAVLHWKSFNIDQGNSVHFEQPSPSAVALNRIFQNDPSRIFGKLEANGQVFLINRNGFLFGRDSVVDVNSLVASTLNIDERIFEDVGLIGAINEPGNPPVFEADGDMGPIEIDAGAQLHTRDGGRIMILAPNITNRGTIETPGGQAILAASRDKVYLAASDDPDVRGLLVEVDTGGDVTNLGRIVAERGNVSLLGLAVNQRGLVRATTSATLNGSIRLLAQDQVGFQSNGQGSSKPFAKHAGDLTLGEGSRTEVLPDAATADELAPDSQLQPQSSVKLVGRHIELESGASLTAPGADVSIQAVSNPNVVQSNNRAPEDDVRLHIAAGAGVDVSGTDGTVLPVTRNIIEVEARGNELADSPRQRDGVLRGRTLRVDVRKGSPLLDISGALANIKRSTRERLADGGRVTLLSGGELIAEAGSRIDIGGGRVTYTGGLLSTTKLITDDRQVVDIGAADPNRVYRGVLGDVEIRHDKWGIVERFTSPAFAVFESGYVEGHDAGSLTLNSPRLAFAGTVQAGAVNGRWQRRPTRPRVAGQVRPFDERPFGGALDVRLSSNETNLPSLQVAADTQLTPAPVAGEAIDPLAPATLSAAMLNRSGLGRISLNAAGEIRIAAGGALALRPDAELQFEAGRIRFDDSVRAPGGHITASAAPTTAVAVDDVSLTVAEDVSLDVGGLWTNDNPLLDNATPTAPVALDGGAIELEAGGALRLGRGSRLRADAGAWLQADGRVAGGDGGVIALSAVAAGVQAAPLVMDGTLSARGFSDNGELRIDAEGFTLNDTELAPGLARPLDGFGRYRFTAHRDGVLVEPGARLTLRQTNLQLTPGFAQVAGGASLPAERVQLPDWVRRPVDLTLVSKRESSTFTRPPRLTLGTGADIAADPGARVTLSSDTSLDVDGRITAHGGTIDLVIEPGNDVFRPEQKIRLGDHAVLDASGTFVARPNDLDRRSGRVFDAGRVRLTAKRGSLVTRPGSLIDVHGVAATLDLPAPSPQPGTLRFAPVTVAGRAGEVELLTAESALLQGRFDARTAAPTAEGGRFALSLDPGRRSTASLLDELSLPEAERFPRTERVVRLSDYDGVLPAADAAVPEALNGQAFVPAERLLASGFSTLEVRSRPALQGQLPATLESTASILFDRDLTLNAGRALILDAPVYRNDGVAVNLSAPYVALGSTFDLFLDGAVPQQEVDSGANRSLQLSPSGGDGRLVVQADLADIRGHSTWQGFGAGGRDGLAIASRGDIRLQGRLMKLSASVNTTLTGALRTGGDVRLSARQIYPTTLSDFRIAVAAEDGGIRIGMAPGVAGQALSAGGRLTLDADVIEQGGVLRAPLGELAFNGAQRVKLLPGSLTSVSAAGLTVPFGRLQFQTDLTFPFGNVTDLPDGPPARAIRLAAPAVDLAPGAQLDLSGGGQARAWEFVPGPGGKRDILRAELDDGGANPSFALLPQLGSAFSPWDPLASPAAETVQGLRVGDTLQLAGGAGIPAGAYAVLPARYALYGGYLVTPVAGTQDFVAGTPAQRDDGAPILAGRHGVAGTAFVDSRSQGYAIENGARVRVRAEYVEKGLDTLFPDAPTQLADAGRLTIEAGQGLNLGATLLPNRAGGRGAQVDISADSLRVVTARQGTGIELTADELAGLGAESLLLGGTRRDVGDTFQVTARARRLTVDDAVDLALPELILVAGQLQVGATQGATLRANGPALNAGADLDLQGDAALLAVSARRGLQVRRSRLPDTPAATLDVAGRSQLLADGGALVLDAPGELTLDGILSVQNGSLQLGAAGISLGNTDGLGLTGLVLNNADLGGLAGADLILRSSSGIDVYGGLDDADGNPIRFGRLNLDASGLVGHDLAGGTLLLGGDRIELANFSDRRATAATPAGGDLRLEAGRLVVDGAVEGPGFALAGFDSSLLRADNGLRYRGGGRLVIDGDVRIETPRISADSGARGGLQAAGRLTLAARDSSAATLAGLAAGLDFTADAIRVDTAIALPSGTLKLNALGSDGITLGGNAVIDVAGRDEDFAGQLVATPGGRIELAAAAGDIRLEGGRLDVSAAPSGGTGGALRLAATRGALRIGAGVQLAGAGTDNESGAAYHIDSGRLMALDGSGDGSLTPLLGAMQAGDFTGEQTLRLRTGNLQLAAAEQLAAHRVSLAADQGDLTLAGRIDAGGSDGGRITLAAGDRLVVSGELDAAVHAADGAPGRIELLALDPDADGLTGLTVDARARLDLTGGGRLQLLLPATDSALTGLDGFAGTVDGAAVREVLGVRVLHNPGLNPATGDSVLDAAGLAAELTALDTFWQATADSVPAGFRLRPALDVRADQALRLTGDIDLFGARFGAGDTALPGVLMLRAGTNLTLDAGLSDGAFQGESALDGTPTARLGADDSWSYLLTGGADFSSATLDAVGAAGDVTLAAGRRVRTGTGDIDVVAAGDLLMDENAAIFTFGRDAGSGAFGGLVFPQLQNNNGQAVLDVSTGGIQFGRDGGDVRLTAGGDLAGPGVTALNQTWQPKIGGDFNGLLPIGELPVIRGINVDAFAGGAGVLGGGRLLATAGHDIHDLSLVMPASLLPVAGLDVTSGADSTRVAQSAATEFADLGGRAMRVTAGRDLANVYLQADRGRVRVTAGRDIRGGGTHPAVLLGVGDADVALQAARNLVVDQAFDPGLIPQPLSQFATLQTLGIGITNFDTLFVSQGERARLTLTSVAGDLDYRAAANAVFDRLAITNNNSPTGPDLLAINSVPSKLTLQSLQGDVGLGALLSSLPAADGRIRLLAAHDIALADTNLVQSDADPAMLPDARFPVDLKVNNRSSGQGNDRLSRALGPSGNLFHALSPLHAQSTQSNLLVARSGDIRKTGLSSELDFANQTRLVAGRDITGLALRIQHANARHVSLLAAGRDIRQQTLRSDTGRVDRDFRAITIAGPGHLRVQAGRRIDLGASNGIESIGDTANPVLPDSGASISVLAGHRGEPDYAAFAERYVAGEDTYLRRLRDFLDRLGIEINSDEAARAALAALDAPQRRRFLDKVFFAELKASGLEATSDGSNDYSRGFAAIDTLFPNPDPDGRLDLKLSKIFTLDGGDIDLLVPGGLIDGGATNVVGVPKTPDQLGVVTGRSGDISAFVDGDFLVNQSRVFALNGDLLMWSSHGNIDAGRGAKTALASPPPVATIDPKTGQTVVEFPPNITGSGLLGINGFLFAPQGVINAGDAGIKAVGNLTLGATEVLGAGNIDVGGISVGVPVANTGGLAAGLTGVSNVAGSATRLAEENAGRLGGAADDNGGTDKALGVLSVEILGFGSP